MCDIYTRRQRSIQTYNAVYVYTTYNTSMEHIIQVCPVGYKYVA